MRRGLATLVLTSLFAGLLPGQEKPPTFPSSVELVTVDVVVVDKQGNPVTDLGPGDFTLLEDDKPQVIASFDVARVPYQSTNTMFRPSGRAMGQRWSVSPLDESGRVNCSSSPPATLTCERPWVVLVEPTTSSPVVVQSAPL